MQKIQQDEPHTHDHRVNCRQYFFSSTCFPDFLPRPKHPQAKKDKKRKKATTDKHAKGKKRKSDESEKDERKKSPKKRQGQQIEWLVAMCVCVR